MRRCIRRCEYGTVSFSRGRLFCSRYDPCLCEMCWCWGKSVAHRHHVHHTVRTNSCISFHVCLLRRFLQRDGRACSCVIWLVMEATTHVDHAPSLPRLPLPLQSLNRQPWHTPTRMSHWQHFSTCALSHRRVPLVSLCRQVALAMITLRAPFIVSMEDSGEIFNAL